MDATDESNANISTDSDDLDTSSEVSSPAPISRIISKSSQQDDISIEQSCQSMVEKIAEYLNGELAATSEDYKLIETLNKLTITKYDNMSDSTNTLITKMQEINDKYKSLQPYLTQIDLLEESVLKLEKTAYKLDAYSKQLETKFKNAERR